MAKKPQPPINQSHESDAKPEPALPRREQGTTYEYSEFSWQAPLPPPSILRQINEVIPNGAERWMRQFEAETQHRHLLERRRQTYPFIIQLVARATALLFAFAGFGVAVHAINTNQPWVAAGFGGAAIAIGVSAFLRQSTGTEQVPTRKPPPAKR